VDRADVLIVGGGPAGSSCAWGLRTSGLDAVVLDRAEFPRDKICAGWVTPPVFAALGVDPADYGRGGRTIQPVHGFRVSRLGDRVVDVDYGEVVSYGIRRCELDGYLLERTGARLRLGEPLRTFRREGDGWVVNDALRAGALVGAGGHFCPVARELTGAAAAERRVLVRAQEVEFPMTPEQAAACPVRPELPELMFTRDLKGYGWVVRKGDWLNVGLGRQDPERFPEAVRRFVDELVAAGRVPADMPRKLEGHAYLLHASAPRPLTADGALLLGDAAGLAYDPSGEGIRPAVESGLLAAEVLRASGGRADPAARRRYEEAVQARFGPRRGRPRRGLTDLLPARWRGPISGRILAQPTFARRIVLDRWFLHRQTPTLEVASA